MAHILISSSDLFQARRWKTALEAAEHETTLLNGLKNVDVYLSQSHATIWVVDGNLLQAGISPLTNHIRPYLKILIIGANWSDQQQVDALLSGCAGYCELRTADKLLPKAVNRLLKGDIWIQRHLVPKVIRTLSELNHNLQAHREQHSSDSKKKLALLSSRELEVANLIQSGENNKKIASQLNISERTVKAHLTSIFSKLEIHDRLHLALFLKETSTPE